MLAINEITFSEVYGKLLNLLQEQEYTREVSPRGQPTLEVIKPIGWTIDNPWNCWLTLPGRKLNPFFAAAEVFWILVGRGDVNWICKFNKNMRSFADGNAVNFNAGYGQRIFSYVLDPNSEEISPTDQVEHVVRKLKKDPDTRQAAIGLWHPYCDNRDSKDIACLSGDTIVRSPEGDIPVSDLCEKFIDRSIKYPVYSFNENSRSIEFKYCTAVKKTGIREVLKLYFDDGTHLKCTGDHLVYRKSKVHVGWRATKSVVDIVKAEDLKVGNRLWATKLFEDAYGYPRFIKNLSQNYHYNNQRKVHREYYEWLMGEIPKGFDIHHIDSSKLNNSIGNLMALPNGEHAALNMFGDANPMRCMAKKDRQRKGKEHSEKLTGRKRPEHSEFMKEYWKKKNIQTNHKIIKIEKLEPEPVYDLYVEDNHNLVVGSGVVVHNCNNMVYFTIRNNRLWTTVMQRSNDVVWGTPYNMVQFQHLAQLVIGELEDTYPRLGRGCHTHVVNSLHVYEDLYEDTLKRIQSSVVRTGVSQRVCNSSISRKEFEKIAKQMFDLVECCEHKEAVERMITHLDETFVHLMVKGYWGQLAALPVLYRLNIATKEKVLLKNWIGKNMDPLFIWLVGDFWSE